MGGANEGTASPEPAAPDKMTLILFSGDLDKVMAAFILAVGVAAMAGSSSPR